MKIKQRPEDFSVTESYRYEPDERGAHRVYLMDKQKVGTLEAVERIRSKFGLKREQFSFCGLKDKQGRTKQLIAVDSADVSMQEADLRLKYLGRSRDRLSAANITSNRFSVTVRDLTEEDLSELPASVAEVHRVGVINYFDSQRFGYLKHGQGFIAKELVLGHFEQALKLFMGTPSELDQSDDAKVKAFWRDRWGEWDARCPIPFSRRYQPIVDHLRENPKDFANAFLKIDMRTRAMVIFTYQSFLWNESVRRYLMARVPHEMMIALPYQAGTLLFPRDVPPEVLKHLRTVEFPLLAPETRIEDAEIQKAVDWVMGREKLTLSQLAVPGVKQLFFKHELRPLVIYPGKLVIGKPGDDELQPGFRRVNVAFTLPPGAYATLVVKRLFWFELEKGRRERLAGEREEKVRAERAASIAEREANPPLGFRAQQALKKKLKRERRNAARPRKS